MEKSLRTLGRGVAPVILLAAALGVEAQAERPVLTKQDIIGRAWAAMFGDRSDQDIRSLYVEGYFHGSSTPERMTVKRPNLFRNETRSGVLVFDGKRAAWASRPPDETGRQRGPELIEPQSWRHFEVDIALLFPAIFDHPSELEGIDKVNGADAYRLRVDLPLGGTVTYFVDTGSFLVTRRLVDWNGGGTEAPWENLIDGWQEADGIRFPDGFAYEGRQGREKGTYGIVRFNVETNDGLFAIPPGL